MILLVVGLVGVALGVLTASSQVPRVRWAPSLSSALLISVTVWLTIQSESPWLAGMVFFVAVMVSLIFYAGILWSRENLESRIGPFGWMRREITNPGYARRLFAASQAPRE